MKADGDNVMETPEALPQDSTVSAEMSPRNEFESVKMRLEEIADAVSSEGISLDEALDLYEEAVALGLQASDLLEVDIIEAEEDVVAADAADPAAASKGEPEEASPSEKAFA